MKKYEALYDWPISQLSFLSDSTEAEAYSTTLGGQALDDFVDLTEKLRAEASKLDQCKATRSHYAAWADLRGLLKLFCGSFGAFPNASLRKLELFTALCEAIAQLAPDLDSTSVDETAFCLYPVQLTLPISWFARRNARNLKDSVVYLKPTEIPQIEECLASTSTPPDLLFSLLATLTSCDPNLPEALALIKAGQRDPKDIDAFVRLHLLMAGLQTHTPKTVRRTPDVIDPDSADVDAGYSQWNDVFAILSEYNSRDELLIKFLTLYQVVEGFMFKLPIVNLEKTNHGAMFSLREFRRLYAAVSVNEIEALESLFKMLFPVSADGGSTFQAGIEAEWTELSALLGLVPLNEAVVRLGAKLNGTFGSANGAKNYAKLVYVLRNSIVHNKETEFHLTSETLTTEISSLLELFLLPTLERIAFWIVSVRSSALWYSNRKLALY